MLVAHFLDLVPIWLLMIMTVVVMVISIEFGFRLGRIAKIHAKKAQTSQVRAIMGAGLGLLAFMLAFTFSIAQSHYEVRVQSLAEEARIARNAYMQADFLTEPRRSEAKNLLRNYIQLRVQIQKSPQAQKGNFPDFLRQSELSLQGLWSIATFVDEYPAAVGDDSMFKASIIALTDIHFTRVHSAVMNRIPLTIWITLFLMAALSMIIMGYQAGLTGRRSPVATITLALAFAAVIILITDLDRPVMSLFEVNKQLLVDLSEFMEEDLRPEVYPADES